MLINLSSFWFNQQQFLSQIDKAVRISTQSQNLYILYQLASVVQLVKIWSNMRVVMSLSSD